MYSILKSWFHRHFSDPEAVWLVLILTFIFTLVMTMSSLLAPVFASIVVAYLLQWLVNLLVEKRLPRLAAVIVVYLGFLSFFLLVILFLWPLVWQQRILLLEELPNMLSRAQEVLYLLPEKFPEYISTTHIDNLTQGVVQQLSNYGKNLITVSLASIGGFITILIYVILVPFMVFFFLKDQALIVQWATRFLPQEKGLMVKVWKEVDFQIGNYVRGKVAEVLIIGIVSFILFQFLGLKYSVFLGLLVGLSVLVPYVGAVVVTFPVLLVGYFQWGFDTQFTYLLTGYMIIQILDGNLLVPLLFSEAVNLHPVAIIIAILVFGGIWGFWGVFFAIPLATLVKAVINAWPYRP